MPKVVCVTGANGFVGSELVRRLLTEGYKVKVLSRSHLSLHSPNLVKFNASLAGDSLSLKEFIKDASIIFHCAGETQDESKMFGLHVGGTQRLIDVALDEIASTGNLIHWVQLSSVGVYGPPIQPTQSRVVNENSEYNPKGTYETTKTVSDFLIINASKNNKLLTFSILRPSNIVGIKMRNKSVSSLIQAVSRRMFFYIGTRSAIANYIHINDVVDALLECAIKAEGKGHIFNLSNDCTYADIFKAMAVVGYPRNYLCLNERLVRVVAGFMSFFFRLPLTSKRIDALVSKTKYPSNKITQILGVSPSRNIPEFFVQYSIVLKRSK